MPEILFTDPALNQFRDLEKKVQNRIISKLKNIKESPNHYLKPLKGYPYFSLRIGDYRAIIDWRKEQGELWIVSVGHRRNIYEKDF